MECVIGLYKTECIRTTIFHQGPYRTIADVEFATARWVDWYNHRRLHSSLAYVSPAELRDSPLRDPQPRAATRMRAAENPRRFRLLERRFGETFLAYKQQVPRWLCSTLTSPCPR